MGLLDKLLQRKPRLNRPVGDSGRAHMGGFLELEELNHELQGQAGLRVYDRMYRTDHDVHGAVRMAVNPIVGGTWSVEPHGGEDADDQARQVADDVAWALGIGPEAATSPLRPRWPAHLDQALPVLVRSGHCVSEVTWTSATRDGRLLLTPARLGLRLPRTLYRWEAPDNDLDELVAIEQFLPTGGIRTLPRQDVLYYRVGAEGNNWEGVSMLRPVYKAWLLKDRIERMDAIAQEREAVGLPVVYPPASNVDSEVLADLERRVELIRTGELAYLFMPGPAAEDLGPAAAGNGWRFSIEGLGGGSTGSRDPQPSLAYHRAAVRAAFIEEFMRLGQDGVGARATSQDQHDPFQQACEVLAGVPEGECNDLLVRRFVTLNYGPDTPCPDVTMGIAEEALSELRDFAAALVAAGAIHADDPLEDHLRERADLPPADPEQREQRKQAAEQQQLREQEAHDRGLLPAEPEPGAKGTEKETIRETRRRGKEPAQRERVVERTRHLDSLDDALQVVADHALEALEA